MQALLHLSERLLGDEASQRLRQADPQAWMQARVIVSSSLVAAVMILPPLIYNIHQRGVLSTDSLALIGVLLVLALPPTARWHKVPLRRCTQWCLLMGSLGLGIETVKHGVLHPTNVLWVPAVVGAAALLVSPAFGFGLAAALAGAVWAAVAALGAGWLRLAPELIAAELAIDAPCAVLLSTMIAWLNDRSRRQMSERLVAAYRLASLGALAGGIAHEVNTPLAVITMTTRRLQRREDLDEPLRQGLDRVLQSTLRITKVVATVRQYAGVDEDRVREPVALAAVVRHVLELVQTHARSSGIELRTEVPEELATHGSLPLLAQALMSLVANAVQAVEEAAVRSIRVSGERAGACARLVIEDSGAGVAPEAARRMFDPFFTTRQPGEGFGLGLSVADAIVQRHGGRVFYEPGAGAGRFVMELPLATGRSP